MKFYGLSNFCVLYSVFLITLCMQSYATDVSRVILNRGGCAQIMAHGKVYIESYKYNRHQRNAPKKWRRCEDEKVDGKLQKRQLDANILVDVLNNSGESNSSNERLYIVWEMLRQQGNLNTVRDGMVVHCVDACHCGCVFSDKNFVESLQSQTELGWMAIMCGRIFDRGNCIKNGQAMTKDDIAPKSRWLVQPEVWNVDSGEVKLENVNVGSKDERKDERKRLELSGNICVISIGGSSMNINDMKCTIMSMRQDFVDLPYSWKNWIRDSERNVVVSNYIRGICNTILPNGEEYNCTCIERVTRWEYDNSQNSVGCVFRIDCNKAGLYNLNGKCGYGIYNNICYYTRLFKFYVCVYDGRITNAGMYPVVTGGGIANGDCVLM